jgi:hypothetical protein
MGDKSRLLHPDAEVTAMMDAMLFKSLAASVPVGLLIGSILTLLRDTNVASVLQIVGAAGLMVVAIAHICEALRVLSWMRWGEASSMGHFSTSQAPF